MDEGTKLISQINHMFDDTGPPDMALYVQATKQNDTRSYMMDQHQNVMHEQLRPQP